LPIHYEKRDGVAYITLNNPEKANILDKPTSDAISQAWIDFWEDRDIRCAILTGAGNRHFCGGHNLAPRRNITEEEREYLRTQRIFWPLAGTVHGQKTGVDGRMGDHYPRVWKPVIAAVSGYAVAGGLELALWCDLRVADEAAIFGVFCRRWGVPLIDGGTVRLPRLIGTSRAMDMILTGRAVGAAEAGAVGLANRVVPAGHALAAAQELAAQLAAFPQVCLRSDRASVLDAEGLDETAALASEFAHGQAALASETAVGAARFAAGAGRHGNFGTPPR